MKIVCDKNIPFLEGRLKDTELVALPAPEITREAVADADGIIVRTRTRCDSSLLEGSKVRAAATATIGTDHLDLEWLAAQGIAASNAPGCNAPGVAVYVWSSLLRNGFDPARHTLGVVGCGHVGSIVADWGGRLGAKVVCCDPPLQEAGNDSRAYLPLEEVLSLSDAVTLHTPLTRGGEYPTFHMIDSKSLRSLKPGAILVNAARGEVVDTPAVCDAIESGRIGKAIIDTWEHEPDINHQLLGLSDIATPHIAGYSVEGKQRATRMALEAISRALGIEADLSGLAPAYSEPAVITPQAIIVHFDPKPLTAALKGSPSDFELLRNSYPLHSELS